MQCHQSPCPANFNPSTVCCPYHGGIVGRTEAQVLSARWFLRQIPMIGALTVFPFAARIESPHPIVGLWTVAGCVLLYLLCRGYRRSRVMAPALLLLVASVVIGLRALDELSDPSNVNYLSWAAPTSTWISVVGPLLLIVISWRYLSERIGKSERAKAKPGGRWTAEGLTFAAMLGGLALLVRTDAAAELATFRTFVDKRWNGHPVRDEAELWLDRAAIGAAVGILALVVVSGFVYGAARAVRVGRLVPRPARPTRSQRLKEARERIAAAERMGRRSQFDRFRDGIELMAAAATDAVVMTGRMSWYFVASIGSEIGNFAAIVVAVIVLTLFNALRIAATTLRDGLVLLAESGARLVVASVAIVLLVAASLATWVSAEHPPSTSTTRAFRTFLLASVVPSSAPCSSSSRRAGSRGRLWPSGARPSPPSLPRRGRTCTCCPSLGAG
jgi:hypothetical protein